MVLDAGAEEAGALGDCFISLFFVVLNFLILIDFFFFLNTIFSPHSCRCLEEEEEKHQEQGGVC